MFKLENLQATIEKYHNMGVKEMIDAILANVITFIDVAEQHDITLLSFRCKK